MVRYSTRFPYSGDTSIGKYDSIFLFSIKDQKELVMKGRRDISWQII